jgi:hypothetical protein
MLRAVSVITFQHNKTRCAVKNVVLVVVIKCTAHRSWINNSSSRTFLSCKRLSCVVASKHNGVFHQLLLFPSFFKPIYNLTVSVSKHTPPLLISRIGTPSQAKPSQVKPKCSLGAETCAKHKSTSPCLFAIPAFDRIAGLYDRCSGTCVVTVSV